MQVFASNPNTKPIIIPVRPELRMSSKNDAKNPTPINKAIINAIGYPIVPWPVKPIINESIIPKTNERSIGIILLLIEYPSLIILQKKGKLNFLQKFDTQDPTDVELDVAAFGIEVWYENEIKDDK